MCVCVCVCARARPLSDFGLGFLLVFFFFFFFWRRMGVRWGWGGTGVTGALFHSLCPSCDNGRLQPVCQTLHRHALFVCLQYSFYNMYSYYNMKDIWILCLEKTTTLNKHTKNTSSSVETKQKENTHTHKHTADSGLFKEPHKHIQLSRKCQHLPPFVLPYHTNEGLHPHSTHHSQNEHKDTCIQHPGTKSVRRVT